MQSPVGASGPAAARIWWVSCCILPAQPKESVACAAQGCLLAVGCLLQNILCAHMQGAFVLALIAIPTSARGVQPIGQHHSLCMPGAYASAVTARPASARLCPAASTWHAVCLCPRCVHACRPSCCRDCWMLPMVWHICTSRVWCMGT
jgi:hypothetical protein